MDSENITVTGASSQIGLFLLPLLLAAGHSVVAVTRKTSLVTAAPNGARWQLGDLNDQAHDLHFGRYVIHLAPIWTLPPLIARAAKDGTVRLIAFSSTSVVSKGDSLDSAERQLVRRLENGEQEVRSLCEKFKINWTIFRPTMIYGSGLDANVSAIARFIERFGFFPLVAPALGLRQPVHAADLAHAVHNTLASPVTYSQTYNLSGAEVLTYRALIEKIFAALNRKPRLIFLPPFIFKSALRIAKFLPRYRHVSPAAIDRINQDLAFSYEKANGDFAYVPRRFEFHLASGVHIR